MSITTYSHARLDRPIIPKPTPPQKPLKPPTHDLYLRPEHIARERTTLLIKPHGNAHSQTDYKTTYEAGGPLFSISGRYYTPDRKCRETRDRSGLPLFDIYRRPGMHLFSWVITLPGCKPGGGGGGTICKATPHAGGSMSVWVKNGAREEQLTVRKRGHVMTFFDVFEGGTRVAELRESAVHSRKLALRASSKRVVRPAWEVEVMTGVDMALMAALGVILSEWYFKAD